mmetsp:Transcript_6440/g.8727  ORF Transcript_6440/g.8727 Transcript_6440/m.8727 type:complete len:273 (+) Transcript_6440:157-975(+)
MHITGAEEVIHEVVVATEIATGTGVDTEIEAMTEGMNEDMTAGTGVLLQEKEGTVAMTGMVTHGTMTEAMTEHLEVEVTVTILGTAIPEVPVVVAEDTAGIVMLLLQEKGAMTMLHQVVEVAMSEADMKEAMIEVQVVVDMTEVVMIEALAVAVATLLLVTVGPLLVLVQQLLILTMTELHIAVEQAVVEQVMMMVMGKVATVVVEEEGEDMMTMQGEGSMLDPLGEVEDTVEVRAIGGKSIHLGCQLFSISYLSQVGSIIQILELFFLHQI